MSFDINHWAWRRRYAGQTGRRLQELFDKYGVPPEDIAAQLSNEVRLAQSVNLQTGFSRLVAITMEVNVHHEKDYNA